MKVLLIDDDAAILRCLARSLRATHEVTSASTIASALVVIAAWRPDVIVCDLYLGHESGLALLAELEQTDPDCGRRFVFMSGELDPSSGELRGMPFPWLQKPFPRAELLAVIARVGAPPLTRTHRRSSTPILRCRPRTRDATALASPAWAAAQQRPRAASAR